MQLVIIFLFMRLSLHEVLIWEHSKLETKPFSEKVGES